MKPRSKRLAWIVAGLAGISLAVGLVLNAFRSNLVFFFTPSQIAAKEAPVGRAFRIGGLVEKGSVKRHGTEVEFSVTDTAKAITVNYTGILPDLFKEGKGVVAEGQLDGQGRFRASQVLAKHDENYMPPEAAEALKRAGETNARLSKSLVTEGGSKVQ
jgi:cytochrome c-type biogenesis protein CcmE